MSNESVGAWIVCNIWAVGLVIAPDKDAKIFCLVLAVIWAVGGALS